MDGRPSVAAVHEFTDDGPTLVLNGHGENVLDTFDAIHTGVLELEARRDERVTHPLTHPLYERFPRKWPVVCGTVTAGEWASTVPASLTAEWRIGVAPGETVAAVEREFDAALADVTPEVTFERVSVQFEPSEPATNERVVEAVQAGMDAVGVSATEPIGATYGTDARHYVESGVPTVLFGPGHIGEAHCPDETVDWSVVETAVEVLASSARDYLSK